MSALQTVLYQGGCLRTYSRTSSTGITYEVWAYGELGFLIDNNRADGEMNSLYGLYEKDFAVHKAKLLAER
jgi:hypothetical protein